MLLEVIIYLNLCNGLFEHISNKDLTSCIWMVNQKGIKAANFKEQCGLAVEIMAKTVINRVCLDNLSCIFVAFNNYEKLYSYSIHSIDNITLKKVLIDSDKNDSHKNNNMEEFLKMPDSERRHLSPIKSAQVKKSKNKEIVIPKKKNIRNYSSFHKKKCITNENYYEIAQFEDTNKSSSKKLSFNLNFK